jgi:exopolyphosphatase/guanosine-5'-triphosphate,3'-diphosphate pyrophosphatase
MKKFSLIIFCFLIASNSIFAAIERRAAIDVGSGGTKVTIADVDTDSKKIVDIIVDTSYPVAYQASLDKSQDGTFDESTREIGLKTFKTIKELADSYNVKQISAIATSAFRKSNNGRDFIDEIQKETSIKVRVIPQIEEGEIAFSSALANGAFSRENVVVLDVGTGSAQMTTTNDSGGLTVYMGEQMGSVAFKFYIIDTIQEKEEANTPNPLTEEDVKKADSYARAFARKAYPVIKEKIKSGSTLGIGRLFADDTGVSFDLSCIQVDSSQ